MNTAIRTTGPLILVAAIAIVLGGCASDDSTSPSVSPSVSASVSASDAAVTLSEEVLLPAEDMPEWNGVITWMANPPETKFEPSPLCELSTAQELGARDLVKRGYTVSPGVMYGTNQVAVFADSAAAESAFTTLDDELANCWKEPGSDEPRFDASITQTDTMATFTGSRSCDAAPDRDCSANDGLFEFAGIAVSGDKVTVVTFDVIGQDANWTEDPLAPALEESVGRL
jgi:hypothetical protein